MTQKERAYVACIKQRRENFSTSTYYNKRRRNSIYIYNYNHKNITAFLNVTSTKKQHESVDETPQNNLLLLYTLLKK